MHTCAFSVPASRRPPLPLPQVGADGRLVEALALVQEPGDVLGVGGQQLVLSEILDALEVVHRAMSSPSEQPAWGAVGGAPVARALWPGICHWHRLLREVVSLLKRSCLCKVVSSPSPEVCKER